MGAAGSCGPGLSALPELGKCRRHDHRIRARHANLDPEQHPKGVASQMRSIRQHALKTGSNSPGELLIIFSTSAVAVCCCSVTQIVCALAQFAEQTSVLDGDDRLRGETLKSARSACR